MNKNEKNTVTDISPACLSACGDNKNNYYTLKDGSLVYQDLSATLNVFNVR